MGLDATFLKFLPNLCHQAKSQPLLEMVAAFYKNFFMNFKSDFSNSELKRALVIKEFGVTYSH